MSTRKKVAFAEAEIRRNSQSRLRTNSFGAFEELVQCGICLDILTSPRMLPCQHTFCYNCIKTNIVIKEIPNKRNVSSKSAIEKYINCPMCQKEIKLTGNGMDFIENLPKNFYIDSLLELLNGNKNVSIVSEDVNETKCQKCGTVTGEIQNCQHCHQVYCNVCWFQHLDELKSTLVILGKQLKETEQKLKHKTQGFDNQLTHLSETVHNVIQQKIDDLKQREANVFQDIKQIKIQKQQSYDNINNHIQQLKNELSVAPTQDNQVTHFMNIHQNLSKILTEVNHYGEARLIFDPNSLNLDQINEGIYEDEETTDDSTFSNATNQIKDEAAMVEYYRGRSCKPKLLWAKCPRPAGVGIPPWNPSKLYLATTDNHNILILDRTKMKLCGRLSHAKLLCPCGLAFSTKRQEIFVSDKWKHCIHVFSSDGEYLRTLLENKLQSPEGIVINSNDDLVICDTGNDRVIVVNCENGDLIVKVGFNNTTTELYMPTGVAMCGNNIVVADSGNHRIKLFDTNTGKKLWEFGSLGQQRGQFRSAEVVAVGPMGFILVGDAGNARIQVFKSDGQLVKILGSKEGFKWISGIFVTPELDIITTDNKSRKLRIF